MRRQSAEATTQRKKLEEVHFFEEARARLSVFCPGAIIDATGESPDILIAAPDSRVWGVEVTRVYQDGPPGEPLPPKARDENAGWIARRAQHLFERVSDLRLDVAIALAGPANPSRVESVRIAEGVADAVSAATLDIIGRPPPVHLEVRNGPPEISYLRVYYEPSLTTLWRAIRTGWQAFADAARIQREIARKEPLIETYRRRCERTALLLVATGGGPSECLELADEAAAATYRTSFDAVAWYQLFERRGAVLRVSN